MRIYGLGSRPSSAIALFPQTRDLVAHRFFSRVNGAGIITLSKPFDKIRTHEELASETSLFHGGNSTLSARLMKQK